MMIDSPLGCRGHHSGPTQRCDFTLACPQWARLFSGGEARTGPTRGRTLSRTRAQECTQLRHSYPPQYVCRGEVRWPGTLSPGTSVPELKVPPSARGTQSMCTGTWAPRDARGVGHPLNLARKHGGGGGCDRSTIARSTIARGATRASCSGTGGGGGNVEMTEIISQRPHPPPHPSRAAPIAECPVSWGSTGS